MYIYIYRKICKDGWCFNLAWSEVIFCRYPVSRSWEVLFQAMFASNSATQLRILMPSANILIGKVGRVENNVENISTHVRPLTCLRCSILRTFKGNLCKYKRLYHVYRSVLFLNAITIFIPQTPSLVISGIHPFYINPGYFEMVL